VSFNHPSRPPVSVVCGLTLALPAGKITALVGASNLGESTLVTLIERFYDPLTGTVKMDGVDVRELNFKWLRAQIGLVLQEPTLFATAVRANVVHGLRNTVHEHASEADEFRLIKEA
jgi:ATP-binding cassette, subfamily B (MDR/TAP), member 1